MFKFLLLILFAFVFSEQLPLVFSLLLLSIKSKQSNLLRSLRLVGHFETVI